VFKWLLIGLGIAGFLGTPLAILFTPVLGPWAVQWFTYDRHFKRIQITAIADRNQCAEGAGPILVEITNGSSRTVAESSFYLDAMRPGHSFDVSNGGQWSGYIVPPGATLKICAPAVLIGDAAAADPRALLWRAGLSWVRFAD
jgi:hypothetical protein